MAQSSTKSSSSSMINGRTSSSSRNSETGNPIRRSFSGNPFFKPSVVANRSFNPTTPANSPSDHPRRNSISKESILSRSYEEKENGNDQSAKLARVRSPSVTKSTKNFMSPTISAVSKIAVSPRKKVLGDRNEPVRTSLSYSDCQSSPLNSASPKPDLITPVEAILNPEINPISNSISVTPNPKPSKTVKFSESDDEVIFFSNRESESLIETAFTDGPDCVNLDPSFKISPPSSPIVAPLDADPLMPPYDPTTNYLSPRPQFLHYKPNPRIEYYFNNDSDGNDLEDCLVSDEASSTMEMESEEGEEVDEEEVEKIEVNVPSKPHFSKKFKISALLLLPLVLCFSIFVYHFQDQNILEKMSMLRMKVSVSYAEFNLKGSQPLNYLNVTEFYKEVNVVEEFQIPVFDQTMVWWKEGNSLDFMKLEGMNEREIDTSFDRIEGGDEIQEIEETINDSKNGQEIESPDTEANDLEEVEHNYMDLHRIEENDEVSDKLTNAIVELSAEETDMKAGAYDKFAEENPQNFEEAIDLEEDEKNHEELQIIIDGVDSKRAVENYDVSDKSASDVEEYAAVFELAQDEKNTNLGGSEKLDDEELQRIALESRSAEENGDVYAKSVSSDVEETAAIVELTKEKADLKSEDSNHNLALMSILLVMPLIIPAGIIYTRKKAGGNSKLSISMAAEELPLSKQKMNRKPVEEEVGDMMGESCSSEMSSFQYSTKGGGGRGTMGSSEGESHSHGRKTRKNSRRESQASSMEDFSVSASPSYGSFTTYERISVKNGDGEGETVTPVRRSNRIRKQVTSP